MGKLNEAQLSVFGGETAGDLATDITQSGYSLIEHGATEEMVDELIQAYAKFTDELEDPTLETVDAMMFPGTDVELLDDNLDNLIYANDHQGSTPEAWHKYRTNHPMFAKPGGYTNRSLQMRALRELRGVDMADDPKEYYHYTPDGFRHIEEMHGKYDWGSIPPEVSTLHTRFKAIHELGVAAATAAYYKMEVEHPDLVKIYATPQDMATSPIRLLFYHPGQGDLLAGGHYDKGFGTIQLAESHKGFRARIPGDYTELERAAQMAAYKADPLNDPHMHLLERDPQYGIFFASAALSDAKKGVYPDSPFRPTWHDVVNIPELNTGRQLHGRNCARWALIFFTNSMAANRIDKSVTHNEASIDLSTEAVAKLTEEVA